MPPFNYRELREFLIYFGLIGLVVILFTSLTSAAGSFEEIKLTDVNATSPASLIVVDGDLGFDAVLPGYGYERELFISLSLTPSMLRGVKAQSVTVFVKVSALKGENSSVLFESSGETSRVIRFSLVCLVVNGACAPGSDLTRVLKVRLNAPFEGYPYFDRVVVNASLQPIPAGDLEEKSAEIIASIESIRSRINELRGEAGSAGQLRSIEKGLSELNALVNDSQRYAEALDIGRANALLAQSQKKLAEVEGNSAAPQKVNAPSLTGRLFGYDFSFSSEHLLLAVLGIVLISVYLYQRRESKAKASKALDIDKFVKETNENEKK